MKVHRKKRLFLLLVVAVSVCGFIFSKNSQAAITAYTLDWSVIGSGGSAETQLGSTVGQTAIGWYVGITQLGSGFWYGIGTTPEFQIFLPIAIR